MPWTPPMFGRHLISSNHTGQGMYVLNHTQVKYFQRHPIHEVQFEILSNHGHPEHTCLYRVQVHGVAVHVNVHEDEKNKEKEKEKDKT
ncbi:hypothetical protein HMI55_005172 [Coelomomyces lativittatus]|nr:hypothetical protein HMI55_005172 [Coelomomyces lativittatus]